ncbi:MAG: DUF5060 domain-containing protein [Candidatus Goldiibacteriota bacterium]
MSNMRNCVRTAVIIFSTFFVTVLYAVSVVSISDNSPVGQYSKFEITLNLDTAYTNPFDPAQIDITANLTSPTGVTHSVEGFYYQDYIRGGDFNTQSLIANGQPCWKARFAPDEAGTWSYYVSVVDSLGTTSTQASAFTVNTSSSDGFVRVSANDPDYFAFDSKRAFFPVGENIGWAGAGSTYQYDAWLSGLSSQGGNFVRVWQAPWDMSIEWAGSYSAGTTLPGNYITRMQQAWELDYVLNECSQKNIYVMLMLVNHGNFSTTTDTSWSTNPYNSTANPFGGFMATPDLLWTNSTAQFYLQRNWRYMISRYGHYTSLMAWEILNEMEWIDLYSSDVVVSATFHQTMGNYLKAADPYKHLVTTSYANTLNWPTNVWNAGMQIVQQHNYGGVDMSGLAASLTSAIKGLNPGKPFYLGEMGISTGGTSENTLDPTGIFIHNTNWGSFTAKAAGGGFPWWWDTYVHPLNLYYRWKGISSFVAGEDLDMHGYKPVTFSTTCFLTADAIITPALTQWGVLSPQNSFTVNSDGSITPGAVNLAGYLYSVNKPQYRNPPTFYVNMPQAGYFIVNVGSVSTWTPNNLTIKLDGANTVINNTSVTTNAYYQIAVPAGSHSIYVDSTGNDWFQVLSYSLTGYVGALRCTALSGTDRVLGNVQSRYFNYASTSTPVINNGVMTVTGLNKNGTWMCDFWDTVLGTPFASATAVVSSGSASITLPPISKDVAFKLYYTGGAATATPAATAVITLTPTTTPTQNTNGDSSYYNFEDGSSMGWNVDVGAVSNTTVNAYAGLHSIAVNVNEAASAQSAFFISNRVLTQGTNSITVHIYFPPSASNISAKIYIQDSAWTWFDGGNNAIIPGIWNTLTWNISNTPFVNTCNTVGISFTYGSAFNGTYQVDAIDFKQAIPGTTPSPTAIPTPAANFYIYPSLIKKGDTTLCFGNLPGNNRILIYNLNGELIKNIDAGPVPGKYCWNIPSKLAPGVYVYIVTTDKKVFTRGKFAVAR